MAHLPFDPWDEPPIGGPASSSTAMRGISDPTAYLIGQTTLSLPLMDDRMMLVLHQTMDHEWHGKNSGNSGDREDWGRQSAMDMSNKGFTVLRIRTRHWREFKNAPHELHRFRNPLKEWEVEQQMICTMNMRDLVAPTAAILLMLTTSEPVHTSALQALVRSHSRQVLSQMKHHHSIAAMDQERSTMYYHKYVFMEVLEMLSEVEVIPSALHASLTGLDGAILTDVIGVTEASTYMADKASPRTVRHLYRNYSEKVLWSGFNAITAVTGSKLLLADLDSIVLLGRLFERIKVTHIDQQYKAFKNTWFRPMPPTHIMAGVRKHRSSCNNNQGAGQSEMTSESFLPNFRPDDFVNATFTKALPGLGQAVPDNTDEIILSSLRVKVRVPAGDRKDTVGLRMNTYILDDDPIRQTSEYRSILQNHMCEMFARLSANDTANLMARQQQRQPEHDDLDKILQGEDDEWLQHSTTHGIAETDPLILLPVKHGWICQEFGTAEIAAAKEKGLYFEENGGFLYGRCTHHVNCRAQHWEHVMQHFRSNKHSWEGDTLDQLVEKLRERYCPAGNRSEQGDRILQAIYGLGPTLLQKHSDWCMGEPLGHSQKGPRVFQMPGILSIEQHPEFFATLAATTAERTQRNRWGWDTNIEDKKIVWIPSEPMLANKGMLSVFEIHVKRGWNGEREVRRIA